MFNSTRSRTFRIDGGVGLDEVFSVLMPSWLFPALTILTRQDRA
jgi:hypothetical protein